MSDTERRGRYARMMNRIHNSASYWNQVAWREFQTQALEPITPESPDTYKERAKLLGISPQKYIALLRNDSLTLHRMSEIAAAQGKRVRITLEPIPKDKPC